MSTTLVRLVQAGGPQARAAAVSLLDAARAGTLKPTDVAEVKVLLQRPDLADVFSGGLGRDLQAALGGLTRSPIRDVRALASSPQGLVDPRLFPRQFAKDLLVQRHQLIDPRLPREENAQRLLEFFGAYAERFVDLTNAAPDAPVTKLPPEERAKVLKAFEKALTDGGFRELVDRHSGRDGVLLGRALLESKTPDAVRARLSEWSVDAPGWRQPDHPHAALPVAVAPLQHQRLPERPPEAELARRQRTGRRGVLGSNMLWNALHLLRDGAETEEEREALNKLVLTAGLLFVFVAVMATVLLLTL